MNVLHGCLVRSSLLVAGGAARRGGGGGKPFSCCVVSGGLSVTCLSNSGSVNKPNVAVPLTSLRVSLYSFSHLQVCIHIRNNHNGCKANTLTDYLLIKRTTRLLWSGSVNLFLNHGYVIIQSFYRINVSSGFGKRSSSGPWPLGSYFNFLWKHINQFNSKFNSGCWKHPNCNKKTRPAVEANFWNWLLEFKARTLKNIY